MEPRSLNSFLHVSCVYCGPPEVGWELMWPQRGVRGVSGRVPIPGQVSQDKSQGKV